jgi:hypothetical protein
MKPTCKAIIPLSFILAVSAGTLFAQPYSFDENGNGIQLMALHPMPMPFTVAPDPTGGINTAPVLIYSLGAPVVSGDVALMEPDGSTISDLLRFFTPAGSVNSDVIFYSQVDDTLAGVGIPYSANPVRISEVSPDTFWFPGGNQPGATTLGALPVWTSFRYDITTAVPEPSSSALLLVSTGVWLTAWSSRRNGSSVRKGLGPKFKKLHVWPNKSLQATRDGVYSSASRFTSFGLACLSSGR